MEKTKLTKQNSDFMAFQLIPFPSSIIFILIFAVAWIVVLWKLRKRGKIYSILFMTSLVIGVVVVLLSIMASMLG